MFYIEYNLILLIKLNNSTPGLIMNNIGVQLQLLRTRRGLSQRKLATLSGVSNATISLIEHGRTDPSMGMMKRILDSLDVSLAEFFADDSHLSEDCFYAHDELSEISRGPISYLQVGSDLSDGQLQILYECYQPGADTGQSRISHEAEEGGVIIKGRLEVTVGDRVQTLSAGDAYRFNSRIPHRFRNSGNEDCIVISACTPPSF
ncbi:MAG: transcriptional regulator with XRE-family HTH domain [Woeseiaceae bacterium]